ncbi:MAG: hypothetical protein FWE38_03025 [Firmicutes bacterium]|nr:hypothetical protein [Bacillota bacterium]
MFLLLVIPMVLLLTLESLLWKRNRRAPMVSLLGTTVWSLVFVAIAFFATLPFEDTPFQNYSWEIIGFTVLQVTFIICNILLWVKIMRKVPLSVAEPIALFRIILLTVFAWIIFGGALTTVQIILGSVIFLSCMALGYIQGKNKAHLTTDRDMGGGMFLLFLWVLTSVGINLVTQQIMRSGVRPITHATIQNIFILVVVIVMFLIRQPRELGHAFKTILRDRNHIGIGFGGAVGRICFSFALSIFSVNVGLLTAVQVATVALVVALSAVIYKEKVRWYAYPLIIAIIVSATVISLGI